MSLETSFERIAFALEAIAAGLNAQTTAVVADKSKKVAKEVPPAPPAAAVTPPAPPAAAVTPPPPPAPVDTVVHMTAQELNSQLVVEFNRLGGRAQIDRIMVEKFGAASLTSIPEARYSELLEAVRAVVV
jgi:hypothetical protein